MTGVHVRLRVGRERFALPIENVREVAERGTLSAVPGASGAVLGVRNLHGSVLPVFDLARVLAITGAAAPRVVAAVEPHEDIRRRGTAETLDDRLELARRDLAGTSAACRILREPNLRAAVHDLLR